MLEKITFSKSFQRFTIKWRRLIISMGLTVVLLNIHYFSNPSLTSTNSQNDHNLIYQVTGAGTTAPDNDPLLPSLVKFSLLNDAAEMIDWSKELDYEADRSRIGEVDILVTGGFGNIGYYLSSYLASLDYNLIIVDTADKRDQLEYSKFKAFYQADISDYIEMEKIFHNHNIIGIVHLAAVARVQMCLEDEDYCHAVNVGGTENLVKLANSVSSVEWMVFASSREVYGGVKDYPVNEQTTRIPLNIYGKTKNEAEDRMTKLKKKSITLRLSNVYGGVFDYPDRLIPSMLSKAMLDQPIQVIGGKQKMDFSHITDITKAFHMAVVRLIQNGVVNLPESYNVVSGNAVFVENMMQSLLTIADSSSSITAIPQDTRFPSRYEADPSQSSHVLGFTAKVVDIDKGLEMFRNEIRAQRIRYLQKTMSETCPAFSNNDSWLSKLPPIQQCKAYIWKDDMETEVELQADYNVNLNGADLKMLYNTVDKNTYLVSKGFTHVFRADLASCEFSAPFNSSIISVKDLFSTLDLMLEKSKRLNYGLKEDISKPWLTQCSILDRVLDFERSKLQKKSEIGILKVYSPKAIAWNRNNAPSCTLDCRIPQVCLFDGTCKCVPTESSCSRSNATNLKAVLKRSMDPIALSKLLKPEAVFLERAIIPWQSTSSESTSAGNGIGIMVGPHTPSMQSIRETTPKCNSLKEPDSSSMSLKIYETFEIPHLSPADFTLLPFYQGCSSLSDMADVIKANSPPVFFFNNHTSHFDITAMVMEMDYGTCMENPRDRSSNMKVPLVEPFSLGTHAISPMGDFLYPCVAPHDLTVAPTRSFHSPRLYNAFEDIQKVKSVLERKSLVYFGNENISIRQRFGREMLPVLLEKTGKEDYIENLNDSKFCMHLRGTASQLSDMIYSGCIPVIVIDDSLQVFETILDYTKFSIRIAETDIGKLSEILASYTEDELVYKQAHALRIRDAFMYPLDGIKMKLDDNGGVNPARLIATNLFMRKYTYFPIN